MKVFFMLEGGAGTASEVEAAQGCWNWMMMLRMNGQDDRDFQAFYIQSAALNNTRSDIALRELAVKSGQAARA